MPSLRLTLVAVTCALALAPALAAPPTPSADYQPSVGQAGKDVVWVPTPQALVDRMLDMAGLTPQDRLVDLGSGDGRTVITAARRGASARGIEYNPDLVALSRRNAAAEGLAGKVRFDHADIFASDFSEATVVTLFLLPQLNLRLRPTLLAMPPGTRIVSNSFTMEDWKPDETARVEQGCTSFCNAYKWVVPAQAAGTWQLDQGELQLSQTFQMLAGSLRTGQAATAVESGRLEGHRIRFLVGEDRYVGEVHGDRMDGLINGQTRWSARRLKP